MPGMSPKIKAKKGRYGVDGLTPTIRITNPPAGYTIAGVGSPIAVHDLLLSGVAYDDAGDVSTSIVWTSSADGALGTGKNVNVSLSVNTHVITATITVGGDVVTDTVTIIVT